MQILNKHNEKIEFKFTLFTHWHAVFKRDALQSFSRRQSMRVIDQEHFGGLLRLRVLSKTAVVGLFWRFVRLVRLQFALF